jgi:type IV pilus assembly protein PilM
MALALRKNTNRAPVGLDLDGAFIAAVQTNGDGIERAVSTELAPGVIRDGEVADVGALTEAIKEFFKHHDLPRRVRIGVSNQQIVMRQLDLPKIDDLKERTAAVRFQAAEAIAMPLDEVILDHQVVGETISPEGAARQRIVVVAAREAMISRVVEAVRGAGLKAEGVDLDAFALVRALATASAPDDSARVYCHLAGITNLAIALGSSCLFTRPLSTSWDDPDEGVANALAEEIRLSIDFYMAQPEARWVGEVILSGPGSRREGLVDDLSGLLQLPASIAEPLGNLDAQRLPIGEDPYRHTVAAGLAMGDAA